MNVDQEAIGRNVAAVRRLFEEGSTRGNAEVCDELVASDAIEHQRGLKGGIEGAKETIRTLHEWFSDFELTIPDQLGLLMQLGLFGRPEPAPVGG